MVVILEKKVIASVNILYYMPDFVDIVQEFIWQTKDVKPNYPRVHKFLNYWHAEIDAVIAEVSITSTPLHKHHYRKVDKVWPLPQI